MRTAWLLAVFVLLFLIIAFSASHAAIDIPRNTSFDAARPRGSTELERSGGTFTQETAACSESVVGVVGVTHAASCSQEDVQVAIDAANDGDTVSVPSGTCIWTTPLDGGGGYTHDPAVLIHHKAITLMGAGMDQTIIVDGTQGCDSDCWGQIVLRIEGVEGKPIRLSGITFRGAVDGPPDAFGAVGISGTCKNFRVDHCKFENNHTRAVVVSGYTYGVIDHCIFIRQGESNQCTYYRGDNHAAWQRPLTLGSANALYIEDCSFEYSGSDTRGIIDADSGARYVIRHNTLMNAHIVHHGPEFGGSDPSTRPAFHKFLG